MKKLLLIPMFILLVGTGCEKPALPPPPPPPPTVVNTPPAVSAGANIGVFLPVDSTFLSGSATDAENNIDSYRWNQLSGPAQANIQTPGLLNTKISTLRKGEYRFELTVIDNSNLSGKATVNVLVIDTLNAGTNSMIFKDLEAICWGPECSLLVDTLNTNMYLNAPLRVFLKSINSSMWVQIPQTNYFFSSNGEYFWIEWYDLDDRIEWEVIIVY